jgi:uncharacterized protein (TIGR03083 family)
MNALLHLDQRLAQLQSDAERIATCAEAADLRASVAGCPGWNVRDLVAHVGFIHRWATHALNSSAPPPPDAIAGADPDATPEELGGWLRIGSQLLVEVLAATPPDADTWHPFPIERKAWVWSRRQMMETAVHRWDAEEATKGSSELTAGLAAVGIGEYLEIGLPRVLKRDNVDPPTASLHVHCTDDGFAGGAGEWVVWSDEGDYRMEAVHRKGDAALRGRAADLLLVLMGRADRATIDVIGDPAAAAAWLDLPGW